MIKVLDLFSGIGGFSLGLERAGMETVAFCEFDKHAQKVLKKHWPEVPIHEDVRTLDGKQFRGSVDVICGGFPCQDISTAGKQEGISAERSGLWSECARLLGEVRPKYAIFENVTNLLNGQRGAWFKRVLWDISQVGYDAEWHCIPASSVGAAHQRDRIWIIAYPNQTQLEGGSLSGRIQKELANPGDLCWGKNTPRVERTANGIPHQMDRLGRLGNSVVPQIPEAIARAILEAEAA